MKLTFLGIVLLCLGCFLLLCWLMEGSIGKLIKWLRHHDDRISSLEVKDYNQDARLDMHRKHLIQVKKDVKQLGKDVGWDDSNHGTQVMNTESIASLAKKTQEPPDEPPPNAA